PLLVSSRRRPVGPTGCEHVVNSPATVARGIRHRGATVFEVDLWSAGLTAGAARHRLRRLTALTPSAHRSVGYPCARRRSEREVGALVNPPRSDWRPISRRQRS